MVRMRPMTGNVMRQKAQQPSQEPVPNNETETNTEEQQQEEPKNE